MTTRVTRTVVAIRGATSRRAARVYEILHGAADACRQSDRLVRRADGTRVHTHTTTNIGTHAGAQARQRIRASLPVTSSRSFCSPTCRERAASRGAPRRTDNPVIAAAVHHQRRRRRRSAVSPHHPPPPPPQRRFTPSSAAATAVLARESPRVPFKLARLVRQRFRSILQRLQPLAALVEARARLGHALTHLGAGVARHVLDALLAAAPGGGSVDARSGGVCGGTADRSRVRSRECATPLVRHRHRHGRRRGR